MTSPNPYQPPQDAREDRGSPQKTTDVTWTFVGCWMGTLFVMLSLAPTQTVVIAPLVAMVGIIYLIVRRDP
ncbi:hypothetical protein FYK55_19145 [Roseiconus nitratireducens]|uniref:Uncharacterized protein n=1 Tax=Roseiconus nitratireducens TaxID=2605748 RepID=A0A5M6D0K4_9BACT|nr:hypothetical protein [Roseiconus nitratireducens]KAA5541017.1 hypothetical protein FYK55_19145 [Roseiconus nitratireducens]